MALVSNAVDTMGPSMRVYSTRPLRCRNTFCHRFLLVTSKDSRSRSIWMHTYCRTTHTERGFPTCPHPKVKFIQNLILIYFPGLMLKFTGVYVLFSPQCLLEAYFHAAVFSPQAASRGRFARGNATTFKIRLNMRPVS